MSSLPSDESSSASWGQRGGIRSSGPAGGGLLGKAPFLVACMGFTDEGCPRGGRGGVDRTPSPAPPQPPPPPCPARSNALSLGQRSVQAGGGSGALAGSAHTQGRRDAGTPGRPPGRGVRPIPPLNACWTRHDCEYRLLRAVARESHQSEESTHRPGRARSNQSLHMCDPGPAREAGGRR